jgi:stage IV sporulation protein FB
VIFAEPPVTRLDLRFRLGRVPVRIHPFFWLSTLGLSLGSGATALGVAMWVVAVLVSILVHELGHAMAFRRFGWKPRITLYGFGGLASADAATRTPMGKTQILISAAGPFAGFALGGLVVAAVLALGYQVPLVYWTLGAGPRIPSEPLFVFVADMTAINLLWGLINLLPVHPLDGGQIALEVARGRDPVGGVQRSVWLSFFVGTLVAILSLVVLGELFTTILFGYLAFMSWQVLRRRYAAGLGSLRVVTWTRRRWRAWQDARRRSARDARVTRDLRNLERLDEEEPDAEAEKAAQDVLNAVSEDLRRKRAARPKPDRPKD